jgi:hypothetical protein
MTAAFQLDIKHFHWRETVMGGRSFLSNYQAGHSDFGIKFWSGKQILCIGFILSPALPLTMGFED